MRQKSNNGTLGWQWHQLDHMQTYALRSRQITTPVSYFYGLDALPDTKPTASSTEGCQNVRSEWSAYKFTAAELTATASHSSSWSTPCSRSYAAIPECGRRLRGGSRLQPSPSARWCSGRCRMPSGACISHSRSPSVDLQPRTITCSQPKVYWNITSPMKVSVLGRNTGVVQTDMSILWQLKRSTYVS